MRYLSCLLALLFASPLLADTIATCATENGPIVSGPTGCLSTGPLGDTASVHINQSLINTANNTIQYSLSASTVTQQVSEPICCAGTKDLATLEINQSYILSGSPAYFTYTYDLSAFSNYGSAVFSFTVGGVQYMCAGFCDPARLGFYFPMDGSGLSFDLSMEGYSTSFEASGYSMIGPGTIAFSFRDSNMDPLSITASPTPEPSAMGICLLGIAFLIGAIASKKRLARKAVAKRTIDFGAD